MDIILLQILLPISFKFASNLFSKRRSGNIESPLVKTSGLIFDLPAQCYNIYILTEYEPGGKSDKPH